MIALIDRPDLKVEIRDDLADKYEVCRICSGRPYRYAHVGADLWGRWNMYQSYVACDCRGGIRLKE